MEVRSATGSADAAIHVAAGVAWELGLGEVRIDQFIGDIESEGGCGAIAESVGIDTDSGGARQGGGETRLAIESGPEELDGRVLAVEIESIDVLPSIVVTEIHPKALGLAGGRAVAAVAHAGGVSKAGAIGFLGDECGVELCPALGGEPEIAIDVGEDLSIGGGEHETVERWDSNAFRGVGDAAVDLVERVQDLGGSPSHLGGGGPGASESGGILGGNVELNDRSFGMRGEEGGVASIAWSAIPWGAIVRKRDTLELLGSIEAPMDMGEQVGGFVDQPCGNGDDLVGAGH
jgi:hypothetical protein